MSDAKHRSQAAPVERLPRTQRIGFVVMLNALKQIPSPILYILAVFLEKAFAIVTVPLMAAHLSPSDYGRFDQALSLCELVAILMTLGAADSLVRFASVAQTEDERRKTAADLLGTALIAVLVVGVIVQLSAAWIAAIWKTTFDLTALRFGLAAVSVVCLIDMPLMWIRFNNQAYLFLIIVLTRTIFTVGGTWLMLTWGYGGEGVLIFNSVIILLSAVALTALQIHWVGVSFSLRGFRQIAVYGLPLVGAGIAMFAMGNLNRWFLAGNVSFSDIGQLGLATRLAVLTALVLQPFILWWGPRRLADLQKNEGLTISAKNWSLGYSLLILSSLGVALAGPVFITVFLPPSFSHASDYLQFLVLVQLLNTLSWLCATGVFARANGMTVLTIDATAALCAVIGFALLIPHFGVAGAITGVLIGHAIRLLLYLWAGAKTAPIPYPTLAAVAALVLCVVMVALAPSQQHAVWRTLFGLACLPAMILILSRLGLFQPPQELTDVIRTWGRDGKNSALGD